ncbi:MAG TPA: hypothetical protein VHL58_16590 [Thermoanaerobaculia bacterium]|nr:hypothetical protein [Thermoanaerobaculia bacterium]
MIEGFPARSLVVLNLVNPKEKFWGMLLSMSPAGVTIRGINMDAFEDWVRQLNRDEEEQGLDLATMFVPLFRVERIFLDEPVGSVQSYSQFFEQRVGIPPADFLGLN